MLVIGLTGSIGMGKSTVAGYFHKLGLPVHDADKTVHSVMAPGGVGLDIVSRLFPDVAGAQGVDRKKLAEIVFNDADALKRLEDALHPIVYKAQRRFLAHHARARAERVVLDVPLLFETGLDRLCDVVVVVSAPAHLQRARVLARPGMNEARLQRILRTQMSDADKCARADFVIRNGLNRAATFQGVRNLVSLLDESWAGVWAPVNYPLSNL